MGQYFVCSFRSFYCTEFFNAFIVLSSISPFVIPFLFRFGSELKKISLMEDSNLEFISILICTDNNIDNFPL